MDYDKSEESHFILTFAAYKLKNPGTQAFAMCSGVGPLQLYVA
jgi:hypothetical protein